jgi:DNA-binding transcriptional ArsR family regulator
MQDSKIRTISDDNNGRNGNSDDDAEASNNNDEDRSEEAYADNTALTKLFGDHPRTKILVAFLGDPNHDLNAGQISDSAGLSTSAVYKHIDQLEELGIISKTRTVSGSQMYRLNNDDPLVEHIGQLQFGLAHRMAEDTQ